MGLEMMTDATFRTARRFGALALIGALAACATQEPIDPRVAATTANTTSEKTEFDVNRNFEGPKITVPGAADSWSLMRSWTNKRGNVVLHQVYVHVAYTGPAREYGSASYEGGVPADFAVIDSGDDCGLRAAAQEVCPRFEDVRINLDPKTFEKELGDDGKLRFRLNPKRGDGLVVEVPPYYIEGYLKALEAF